MSRKYQHFNAIDGSIEMLKIVEFSKISIKLKNFKTFYKHKQRSAWKKLLNPPPGKGFLCLWNKNFWMEIYRNLQTFAFQVLRECSSWASRNGAVQILFLTPARNMFLAVLWEYIFNNVEWVEAPKMSEVFRAILYCKMSDLFC